MTSDPTARRALERADRLCDAAVIFFAIWTLCAHAAVFAGLGLDVLIWISVGTLLAAAATWFWLRPVALAADAATESGTAADDPEAIALLQFPAEQRGGLGRRDR